MAKKYSKKTLSKAKFYIMEFNRCKYDFGYFCRHYAYLELPGQDVLLQPYAKQEELISLIEKDKHVIVLKSRQIGISTVTQVYCAWLAVFYDNVVIGLISKDAPESTTFARTVRGVIEKLPLWMKPKGGTQGPGFAKKSEQSFILTNGSKVYASTVAPNSPSKCLRGKAITFLIIDEAAFIGKLDEAWTSMVPALSTAQMNARKNNVPHGTVILSTPNKTVGPGKWFFDRYSRSLEKDDIFKPFTIHWKDIPELANDPQ